jgi:hypothetical protein
LSARKEEVSAWRLLATAACLISLASCAPDHNYAAGPLAPTDITPEMAKARCRMMVEGRGYAWIASGGPGLVGLAAGDPFPIAAENRRKAQIEPAWSPRAVTEPTGRSFLFPNSAARPLFCWKSYSGDRRIWVTRLSSGISVPGEGPGVDHAVYTRCEVGVPQTTRTLRPVPAAEELSFPCKALLPLLWSCFLPPILKEIA